MWYNGFAVQQKAKTSIHDDAWNDAIGDLAAMLECLPEPVVIVDRDGKIAYLNRHTETLLGYARDELVGKPFDVLVPDRDREQHAQLVRRFFRQSVVRPMGSGLEIPARHKGGKEIPVDIALGPIDLDGTTHVIATLRDETERRLALQALKDSQEHYRRYMDNRTDGIWRLVFDDPLPLDLPEMEQVERLLRDSYFADTNVAFSQQYGFTEPDAMHGVPLEEALPRDDPATVPTCLKVVRARYHMQDLVTFERDRYGNEKVFANSFTGDIIDGKVRSIWGTARDITEQYRADCENKIKSAALDAMIDGCILVDAKADDLPIVYANQRFFEITGYSHDEVMARNCLFLQGPDTDPAVVSNIRESMCRGALFEGEILNYRKDGTPFWNRLRIAPVTDRLGEVTRFLGSVHDFTAERKTAEDTLAMKQVLSHVSRVATLGELTAAIAHELNQPLTAIAANVSAARRFIMSDKPDLQEITDILEDIAMDDKRATDVIRGLRRLLGADKSVHEHVDINELVRQTLTLVKADLMMKHVSVAQELTRALPAVTGDRVQIQQVMLNLIVNAGEAVESLAPERRRIEVKTSQDHERGVRFVVRDYGDGIAEECKARLFEPFFTTKQAGLGMGLAITRTIIESHGGEIQVDNNAGMGATVSFTLPLSAAERP